MLLEGVRGVIKGRGLSSRSIRLFLLDEGGAKGIGKVVVSGGHVVSDALFLSENGFDLLCELLENRVDIVGRRCV